MSKIEEKIWTKVPSKKVWKAWANSRQWKTADSSKKQSVFREGGKGHVVAGNKKPFPFKICNIVQGKSFTIQWGFSLVKMLYCYRIEEERKGTNIFCTVKFRGLLGFFVGLIIKEKVRKNLLHSLNQFVFELEHGRPV